MSIYKNDNSEHFEIAFQSMLRQTISPSEIVLIIDGPIPKTLENTIKALYDTCQILKIVRFSENQGHAAARHAGLEAATNEIVAFMDSDDIALPDRMEKQLTYMQLHPEITIIGGNIEEFIETPNNPISKRIVPLEHNDILHYMQSRCPMNMVTITARRTELLSVGGFVDWYCNEDSYLWIRLATAGFRFANLPDILVKVRVSKEMYKRRGGWRYFKSERGIQRLMLKKKFISLPRYCYNVLGRFVMQVLLPNSWRSFMYRTLFRQKA